MFASVSRFLLRPFIVTAIAASLVFSPVSTAPAQAHSTYTANNDSFIAALVALGLIGLIITNENGKHLNSVANVPRSKRLPQSCLKTFQTTRGTRAMFKPACLQKNFRWWRNLPSQCLTKVRIIRPNGHRVDRNLYRAGCLRDYGYRIIRNR